MLGVEAVDNMLFGTEELTFKHPSLVRLELLRVSRHISQVNGSRNQSLHYRKTDKNVRMRSPVTVFRKSVPERKPYNST